MLASAFTPKITNPRADKGRRRREAGADRANVFDIQPQIWTYEPPAADGITPHRAFVALQGEAATLNHPSYRTFILRGIAWAGKRANLDEFTAPAEVAALRYPPGGPETAEDTVKQMRIEPGFKATVVAAEPLINKPIAVQWDGSGRLWVAETPEYPNGRRPLVAEPWKETDSLVPGVTDRPARDRISILSDPDANGRLTKKSVFYEGLELVTGFCLYRDGVIALHQPDILWIRDTDGDGKADKVERLFTGFTPGDTHFVANHLIAAPDGWIYASLMGGSADVRKPDAAHRSSLRISSGMFRFRPDGSAIEQVSSKGGNGFGADVTSDEDLFFGQATSGNPVQHVAPCRSRSWRSARSARAAARNRSSKAAKWRASICPTASRSCKSMSSEATARPAPRSSMKAARGLPNGTVRSSAPNPSSTSSTAKRSSQRARPLHGQDGSHRSGIHLLPRLLVSPRRCRPPGPDAGAIYILRISIAPVILHSDTRAVRCTAVPARPCDQIANTISDASIGCNPSRRIRSKFRIRPRQMLRRTDRGASIIQIARCSSMLLRLLMERNEPGKRAALLLLQSAGGETPRSPPAFSALWGLQRLGDLLPQTLLAALHDADPSIRKTAALVTEAIGQYR